MSKDKIIGGIIGFAAPIFLVSGAHSALGGMYWAYKGAHLGLAADIGSSLFTFEHDSKITLYTRLGFAALGGVFGVGKGAITGLASSVDLAPKILPFCIIGMLAGAASAEPSEEICCSGGADPINQDTL